MPVGLVRVTIVGYNPPIRKVMFWLKKTNVIYQ